MNPLEDGYGSSKPHIVANDNRFGDANLISLICAYPVKVSIQKYTPSSYTTVLPDINTRTRDQLASVHQYATLINLNNSSVCPWLQKDWYIFQSAHHKTQFNVILKN